VGASPVVSENFARIPGEVRHRRRLPAVFGRLPLAGRLRVSAMWEAARLCIAEAQTLAMHRLSPPGFADRWDDPAQYEDTADSLVLGSVPDDYGQAWHFRITVAAPACLGTVRNSVDDAAQIPASDDQLGTRAATGRSGSR